jgi:hypothetical protein
MTEKSVPRNSDELQDRIITLFRQSEIHASRALFRRLGFSFTADHDGKHFSVLSHGLEIPFDRFVQDIYSRHVAEQWRTNLLDNLKKEHTPDGNPTLTANHNR